MVYFIEATGLGLVKIGKANDVEKRLRALNTASPVELRLLKSLPGDRVEELQLHRMWKDHRVRGEWFDLKPLSRQIEEMERVRLRTVRRSSRDPRHAAFTVECPGCGERREVEAGREREYPGRVRMCAACTRKRASEMGGAATKARGVAPDVVAGWVAKRAEKALKKWEADRSIAEANAVCVDCGKRLKVLAKARYQGDPRLPEGVRSQRRCAECGQARGMREKWKDPEYLEKMRARPTRATPGAGGRDIVKAARTRASGSPDRYDVARLIEALETYRRGLTAAEMVELASLGECCDLGLREAMVTLFPGDEDGVGGVIQIGNALSSLRRYECVLSDGRTARLVHAAGEGRVGAVPRTLRRSKSKNSPRWSVEIVGQRETPPPEQNRASEGRWESGDHRTGCGKKGTVEKAQ